MHISVKWKLKRTVQCSACPWRVDTLPARDIPNGYCETKHANLRSTIAEPGSLESSGHAMACHETDAAHCVGWIHHQLGVGNNLPLRIRMMSCENAGQIKTIGEQHQRFEDTLP